MSYLNAREVFQSALHVLCTTGNYQNRLIRAYTITTQITPARDLPSQLISEYYELQYSMNSKVCAKGESSLMATVTSLNVMEVAVIIEKYIDIYKGLVETSVK